MDHGLIPGKIAQEEFCRKAPQKSSITGAGKQWGT